jgi:hypothetical protein
LKTLEEEALKAVIRHIVTIINATENTNPLATITALEALFDFERYYRFRFTLPALPEVAEPVTAQLAKALPQWFLPVVKAEALFDAAIPEEIGFKGTEAQKIFLTHLLRALRTALTHYIPSPHPGYTLEQYIQKHLGINDVVGTSATVFEQETADTPSSSFSLQSLEWLTYITAPLQLYPCKDTTLTWELTSQGLPTCTSALGMRYEIKNAAQLEHDIHACNANDGPLEVRLAMLNTEFHRILLQLQRDLHIAQSKKELFSSTDTAPYYSPLKEHVMACNA